MRPSRLGCRARPAALELFVRLADTDRFVVAPETVSAPPEAIVTVPEKCEAAARKVEHSTDPCGSAHAQRSARHGHRRATVDRQGWGDLGDHGADGDSAAENRGGVARRRNVTAAPVGSARPVRRPRPVTARGCLVRARRTNERPAVAGRRGAKRHDLIDPALSHRQPEIQTSVPRLLLRPGSRRASREPPDNDRVRRAGSEAFNSAAAPATNAAEADVPVTIAVVRQPGRR